MKKLFLFFSIFVFQFSLCKAQDTLVYKTGEKLGVKVISISGDEVIYSTPADEKQVSVSQSKVSFIKYSDGVRYTPNESNVKNYGNTNSNYMPITINAGIGESIISGDALVLFTSEFVGQGAATIISQSIAYNCTADYNLNNWFTIGIGGAYQWITDNPYVSPNTAYSNIYYQHKWAIEKVTRYNFSVRGIYDFINSTSVDFYCGIRLGASIWTDKMVSDSPPSLNGFTVNTSFLGVQSFPSIQFLLGVKVFPVYNFGFHIEAGIGTPYAIEAGITYRFKTKKN